MITLTATGRLIKLAIRRDRVAGPAWMILLPFLVVGTALQYRRTFASDADIVTFAAEIQGNGALAAFTGQLVAPTLAGLVMWKIGDIAFCLTAMFAMLTLVRHTRAEEETGRSELIMSGSVGRHAPLTSALIVTLGYGIVAGVLTAGGLMISGVGVDLAGAVAFGLSMISIGCIFAVIAAVLAQLSDRARTVRLLAAAVLGVSYLIRFVADGGGQLWLRWLSPLGWQHLVQPMGEERWWVFVLPLIFVIAGAVVAYRLVGGRDNAAGLLPQRIGPAEGSAGLTGPFGLAWRQHRGQIIGWTIGSALAAGSTAAIATSMGALGGPNASWAVQEFFRRYAPDPTAPLGDVFLWIVILSIGYSIALYTLLATLRIRQDEAAGLADALLATRLGRTRWAIAQVLVISGGTTVLLMAAGLSAGVVYGLATGDAGQLPRMLAAAAVQVPPALVVGAIAVLGIGLLPRLVAGLAWAAWIFFAVFGEALGPILGIDYWIANQFVPWHHIPKLLSGGTFSWEPMLIMLGLTAVGWVIGLAALRRRDLTG